MKKILLLIITIATHSLCAQTRESDSLALVDIYNVLDGPNWTNESNWLTDAPIDDWNDVTVFNDRVIKLRLFNNNGSGDFPTAIFALTQLEELFISNLAINAPLPIGISALTDLRRLTIFRCGLTGDLPNDIDQLVELELIDLSRNEFTGLLPDIGPKVNKVNFNSNHFSGPIPSSWLKENMWQVSVNNNQLTGSLDIFGGMPNLDILSLFHNDWDPQPMPSWLDDLPLLRGFQCGGCNLEGDVPTYDFSNSTKLYQIIVNDNNLTGDIANLIPSPIDENLWLDAGNNFFEGELPAHLLSSVNVFAVDNNNFSSISNMDLDYVGRMNLVGNQFTISDLVEPLEPLISDSLTVYYGSQQPAGVEDTIVVQEMTSITLDARDSYTDIQYQWYKNNQVIDGAIASSYTIEITENGIEDYYECRMTHPLLVEDGESVIEFYRGETMITSDFTSSVEDLNAKYHLVVSPNPFRDHIYIQSDIDLRDLPYELWTLTGKKLKSGRIGMDSRIDALDIESKVMVLSIQTAEGVITTRLVK